MIGGLLTSRAQAGPGTWGNAMYSPGEKLSVTVAAGSPSISPCNPLGGFLTVSDQNTANPQGVTWVKARVSPCIASALAISQKYQSRVNLICQMERSLLYISVGMHIFLQIANPLGTATQKSGIRGGKGTDA